MKMQLRKIKTKENMAKANKKPGILILDDDSEMRGENAEIFKGEGYSAVYEAGNPKEGLKCIQKHADIEIIVSDYDMKCDMNGMQFYGKLNETNQHYKNLAKFLLTGSDVTAEMRKEADSLDVLIISKPIMDMDKFIGVVESRYIQNSKKK